MPVGQPPYKRRRLNAVQATDAKEKKPRVRPATERFVQDKLRYRVRELQKLAERSKAAEIRKVEKDAAQAGKLLLLRDVDHERVSCAVLHKRIMKDTALSGDPRLKAALLTVLPSDLRERPTLPSKSELDAEARLTNNKYFQQELTAAMVYLRSLAAQPIPEDRKREGSESGEDEDAWTGVVGDATFGSSEDDSDDQSEEDNLSDRVHDLGDDEDEPDFDDGWESGSVDETGQVITRSKTKAALSDSDSDSEDNAIDMNLGASSYSSGSGSGSDSDSSSPSVHPIAGPSKISKSGGPSTSKLSKAGDSIFLPSLSMGYMPGDHDPYDDYEHADVDGPGGGPERKNRRGQRARRDIWEKKYGRNAKHKQRDRELQIQETKRKADLKAAREAARQNKRNANRATNTNDSVSTNHPTPAVSHTSQARLSSMPASLGEVKRPNAKPDPALKSIHPAWEAKMKMKQKEAELMTMRPQGKKVVFN